MKDRKYLKPRRIQDRRKCWLKCLLSCVALNTINRGTNSNSSKVCISDSRLLSSTSPVLKLRFTGVPSLPLFFAKFIPEGSKISWNRPKSNTLDLAIFSIPNPAQCLSSILSHSSAMSRRTRQCQSATQTWDRHSSFCETRK
jgi:hypothetical protein